MESLQLDDRSWMILKGLTHTPKTPQMLAHIYGIPIVECWQRIRFLEGLGLVEVILVYVSRLGRVVYFYQTNKEAVSVVVEGDKATVFFEPAV
ncbi:MAG: hypothetical protein AABY30_01980 [Candidatus Thermoplasmatota archaeon]